MPNTPARKLAPSLLLSTYIVLTVPYLIAHFLLVFSVDGLNASKHHRQLKTDSLISEIFSPTSSVETSSSAFAIQKSCRPGEWLCQDGLNCISENATCSGVPECLDGSDEAVSLCGCLVGEFTCRKQCIPEMKRCDTEVNCLYGEDEEGCDTWHCLAAHFKCHNGFCIPSEQVCDFVNNCGDNSDEVHCDHRACYFKEFRCSNGECIRPGLLCDGVTDCVDGSDEEQCRQEDFAVCGSGKLVHQFFWCDGAPDCADNHADETQCDECKSHEYKCSDNQCIPKGNICDAQCDCADCLDEIDCEAFYVKKSGATECVIGASVPCIVSPLNRAMDRCISESFLCDKFNHCHNGGQISDEYGCVPENGTCEEENEQKKHYRCQGDRRCLPKEVQCDFKTDCLLGDDEQNCDHRACGTNEWRCASGECVPEDAFCNLAFECQDKSDEMQCENHKCRDNKKQCRTGQCLNPDLWCDFHWDCPDNSDETDCEKARPCSKSEFACADGRQCIPLEGRCALYKDRGKSCADGSHLLNCRDFSCPAEMFKCQSGPCLQKSRQCDGFINCPETWDDEDLCVFQCSASTECQCLHLEADCSNLGLDQLPDDIEPQINRYLFIGNNLSASLRKDYFSGRSNIVYLDLSNNGIVTLPSGVFESLWRLRILILRNNLISELHEGVFSRLHNLRTLDLQGNAIAFIGPMAFFGLSTLSTLDLSNQGIRTLSPKTFVGLRNLTTLNLSNNLLREVEDATFSGLLQLRELNVQNNDLEIVSAKAFATMPKLRLLLTDERRWCCLAAHAEKCLPPADEFSSCEDLMSSSVLRVCIWVLGVIAFVGNTFVIVWRSLYVSGNKLHSFLIVNLALGDLLMGAYLLVIAAVDIYYRGVYATAEQAWRKSFLCKSAGFCSTFSSELSVFTLTVITVDRLIVIKFPFGHRRFDGTGTRAVMVVVWFMVIFLSALPLAPIDYFSDFYGRSGVCLALHITNEKPNGWEYAVFIFLVLNFLSFAIIAVSYILMYTAAKTTQTAARETTAETENTRAESSASMAKRMTLIVITDAACWLPIIALGVVSLLGVTIPPKVYAWVAVFVLPLNAAVNPILYTLSTAPVRKRLWDPIVSKDRKRPHGDPFRASVSCGTWKSSMRTRFTLVETDGETRNPVPPSSFEAPLVSFHSECQLKQNLIQESLDEEWNHKEYTEICDPHVTDDIENKLSNERTNNKMCDKKQDKTELIPLNQLTSSATKMRTNVWKGANKRQCTDQRYD